MTDLFAANPPANGPRLLIVGGSALTRAGVRTLLAESGAAILGAASALDALESQLDRADVVILLGPDDLPALLDHEEARPALLLLDDEWPGAVPGDGRPWGVAPADSAPDDLWAAVLALRAGFCVLPPGLLSGRGALRVQTLQASASGEALSPRENAILQFLAEGLTNRQIAARTNISEHTVKFHLSSIFSKLGVSSRTEAIRVGAQRGLVMW
ncbi:MAG TPA: response regulator transcription factor [Herpetosiphonaceae bacterium]|nr:response regulator transcription factor [Herpetosiphonaceae bacterium]